MIKISAVICTYKRPILLRKTVESLLNQSLNKNEYEILIIDNGCEDEIKHIILAYAVRFSNIRYISEKNLGLSYARNRGIKEAKGKYIAFIDDDADANNEWLSSFTRYFERKNPSPDIIGGKVILRYESADIPKYINPLLEAYYAKLDYGDKDFPLHADKKLTLYINGTNFAIRKEIISKIGYFDTRLGRKGQSLISREESKFLEDAAKRDCIIYYEPKAIVTHFIPKERLQRKYLIRRFFAEGMSLIMSEKIQGIATNNLSLTKQRAKTLLKDLALLLIKSDRRFLILLRICKKTGEIYAAMHNNKT